MGAVPRHLIFLHGVFLKIFKLLRLTVHIFRYLYYHFMSAFMMIILDFLIVYSPSRHDIPYTRESPRLTPLCCYIFRRYSLSTDLTDLPV